MAEGGKRSTGGDGNDRTEGGARFRRGEVESAGGVEDEGFIKRELKKNISST